MADSTPLLSILMPTRNRMECARHAIANILKFEDSDLELIVQDNSDDDALSAWIHSQGADERLHYHRIRQRLSISENFETAIGRAQGRYLCCLGDDDGIHPCVMRLTRWIDHHGIDALSSTPSAQYFWPGVARRQASEESPGRLVLTPFRGRAELCDPAVELLRCARAGAVQLFGLPRIYHGVVRRQCIEQVKQQTGCYAPGVSPDMAASVALACLVNHVLQVDYPVFVPGASATSGAGRGVRKTHHGDLSRQEFLDERFVENWPPSVPRFFSGPTMWGAAANQALQAMGKREVLKKFDHTSLHAACAVFVPSRRGDTMKSFRNTSPTGTPRQVVAWTQFGAACATQWLRRLRRLFLRTSLTSITEDSHRLDNIDCAMGYLEEKLAARPALSWQNLPSLPGCPGPPLREDPTTLPTPAAGGAYQPRASA